MASPHFARMPTVVRLDGFRFFFYSNESNEPPHIHVERGDSSAKFWLTPPTLARSVGFRRAELSELQRLVREHQALFQERWYEYFSDQP
jgi:hypothetical protein